MRIESDKSRLTIGEAARIVGVSKDTLRRWERRGLYQAHRDWRAARVYDEADLAKLRALAGLGA